MQHIACGLWFALILNYLVHRWVYLESISLPPAGQVSPCSPLSRSIIIFCSTSAAAGKELIETPIKLHMDLINVIAAPIN